MIQKLIEYQKADKELKDIETILSGSEERKKAVSARKYLDGVTDSVNKLDDKASSLSAEYSVAVELQAKLKEQEEEIAKALESAETETEINYLVKKAEELLGKIKNINSGIAKISNEIQTIMKEYATIRKSYKVAKDQYNENGAKYKELKASFDDKKKKIEDELEVLKKDVDPVLMAKYLTKRANKMYPIVFEVSGKVCGACNMELSMAELSKLKAGEIIECDQCGRMLYQAQSK